MALDWLPIYPDRVPSDPTHPAGFVTSLTFQVPAAPVPPLAWAPNYPGMGISPTLPSWLMPTLCWTPQPSAIDLQMRWQPFYPSTVPPPPDKNWALWTTMLPARAGINPPVLSWQPTYPGQGVLVTTPPAAAHESWVMWPVPIVGPPAPGQGWNEVTFPDRMPPTWTPPISGQQSFAANLSPIPNPAPPTPITWLPSYPTTVPNIANEPWAWSVATITWEVVRVAAEMRWLPRFPDRGLDTTPKAPGASVFPFGTQQQIPTLKSWAPVYPDRPVTTTATPWGTSTAGPVIIPPIFPSTITCIRLSFELGGQPRLISEIMGTPQLANQAGAQGQFVGAAAC